MLKHVDECVGCPPEKAAWVVQARIAMFRAGSVMNAKTSSNAMNSEFSMASSFAMTASVRKRGSAPRNRRTNREDKR